jgi:hypothetical protein
MRTKYSILNYYIVIFQDMIKKTRILEQFLEVPPDEEYSMMKVIVFFFFLLSLKVALIITFAGAWQCNELTNLNIGDV